MDKMEKKHRRGLARQRLEQRRARIAVRKVMESYNISKEERDLRIGRAMCIPWFLRDEQYLNSPHGSPYSALGIFYFLIAAFYLTIFLANITG